MYGAILGDIIGSPFEFDRGNKTKDFQLFDKYSQFTDDSVMTIAVCEALIEAGLDAPAQSQREWLVFLMKKWGQKYPYAGYGIRFGCWLRSEDTEPFYSCGNGSAMRVSSVGWLYNSIERVREVARITAEITHNHPEGIKGAESVASAIFLARNGKTKKEIKKYIKDNFGYDFSRTCNEIRPTYYHIETCQKTVPEAMTAFFEGTDFEDVIRLAVSLGGDSDTLTAIAGSIAEAFYGVPQHLKEKCRELLANDLLEVLDEFEEIVKNDKVENSQSIQKNTEVELQIVNRKPDVNRLKDIFKDTQMQVKDSPKLAYLTARMQARTRLYLDNYTSVLRVKKSETANISVKEDTTFSCAQKLVRPGKKTAVLNFANAYIPGGSVKQGAMAQEECLCRSSNLYEALALPYHIRHYYKWNQKNTGDMGSDRIIYVPEVTVFKSDDMYPMELEEWFQVDVITCAAPFYDTQKKKPVSKEKLEEVLFSRIKNIVEVAIANDVDRLVLGAFGCGVFNNPPELVAEVFKKILIQKGYASYFEQIVFAIKKTGVCCPNLYAFEKCFLNLYIDIN